MEVGTLDGPQCLNNLTVRNRNKVEKDCAPEVQRRIDWEHKINKISEWSKFTNIFIGMSIILMVILFLEISLFYLKITNVAKESSVLMEFEYSLYSGFKLRNYEMSKRFAIYHETSVNKFPNDKGGRYNVTNLSDFLKKKQPAYVARLDTYDAVFYRYSPLIPRSFS